MNNFSWQDTGFGRYEQALSRLKDLKVPKKKEILSFAIIWMYLEDIMLSELSQSQGKYCMIPLMWGSKVAELIEAESRKVVAMAGVAGGRGELLVNK